MIHSKLDVGNAENAETALLGLLSAFSNVYPGTK